MNSIFKKILSVVLSAVMLALTFLSVVANAGDKEDRYPVIDIPGFMATTLVADVTDPDSEAVWPPSSDSIVKAVEQTIPALLEFAARKDWDSFGDKLADIANELFLPAENDENGEAVGKSGVEFSYPPAESITKDSCVTFKYDWRKDPIVVAGELNDYINYILSSSGSSKVSIQCHSLGSVITTTYATLYGTGKINTVVYNAPALFGETYNGELMTGQITLDSSAIFEYLKYAFDSVEYDNLIDTALDVLDEAGVLDILCSLGNDMLEKIGERVSAKSVVPLFSRWTTIWAMIPDEYIDEAMDYVFTDLKPYYDCDYTKLVEKINSYNTLARPKKTETLKQLNEDCNLYVITRYGYSSLPITPSNTSLSDGVVDAKYASFGAATANYGEKLSDEYINSVGEKYISPDKSIDASTCLFPEQTWFIKNIGHSHDSDALDEMIDTFLYYKGQGTVNTFEQYPQWIIYDTDTDTFSADTSTGETLTFFDKLLNAIADILKLIKNLILGNM